MLSRASGRRRGKDRWGASVWWKGCEQRNGRVLAADRSVGNRGDEDSEWIGMSGLVGGVAGQ